MAQTAVITFDSNRAEDLGRQNQLLSTGTVSVTGSYATGGFTLDLTGRLRYPLSCFMTDSSGYIYKFVRNTSAPATAVVKMYRVNQAASGVGVAHTHSNSVATRKPRLVIDEAVTVTTHVGTLAHVPLYVPMVYVSAGTTTGCFKVIPAGETPLTKQVAVNFTTGVLTFLSTDIVTAASVTYLPKQASGYLAAVTVDETVVASASGVNLAARACAIQYIWDDTDGVLVTPEPVGEQPTATHNCAIDINNSGNSTIDSHADDAGNTLKVTYIPYAQIAPGMFIDDADIALTSEALIFAGAVGLGYTAPMIPGLGNVLVGEDGAAGNHAPTLGIPADPGDTEVLWKPQQNYFLTDESTAQVSLAIPWILLDPVQMIDHGCVVTSATEATHTHDWPGSGDVVLTELDAAAAPGTLTIQFLALGLR
jgi:hypothetical protein